MAFIQCEFFSDVLGRCCSMNVLIPQKANSQIGMVSKGADGRANYPVLYLLHGLSDNHTIWMRRTSIERYAAEYPLAVVMPNGDRGFYTDMAEGDRYWTMLSEELPQIVHSLFPVSDRREDTFVAGLSMGGYGALKLALRCPEKFAGAVALSAVTDVLFWFDQPERNELFRWIFESKERIISERNDLFSLAAETAEKSEKPRLLQVCGTEDGLHDQNIRFRDRLKELAYPGYEYIEETGAHSWDFWDKHIQYGLKFLLGDRK